MKNITNKLNRKNARLAKTLGFSGLIPFIIAFITLNLQVNKIQILEIGNLVQEIKILKKQNFFVYGLDGEGKMKIQEIDKNDNRIALIIGAEGKGLRRLTKLNVDSLIKIPFNTEANSLNVSSAASVAMFQLQKNIIKN